MSSLNDFKALIKTDKFDCWNFWQYTDGVGHGNDYVNSFYDRFCLPIRESATAVLEVGFHLGASHQLWSSFFSNARVYGCDVHTQINPDPSRIIYWPNTDAYQHTTVELYQQAEPQGYDLVIDDGAHSLPTHLFFLEHYSKLVKPGGYLVIEDIDLNTLEKIWSKVFEIKLNFKSVEVHQSVGVSYWYAIVIKI